jgi:hypothetical protein
MPALRCPVRGWQLPQGKGGLKKKAKQQTGLASASSAEVGLQVLKSSSVVEVEVEVGHYEGPGPRVPENREK